MATSVTIDDQLLLDALKLSGCRTNQDAVTVALQEYVARRKQQAVLKLRGKLDFDPTYDYRRQRQRP